MAADDFGSPRRGYIRLHRALLWSPVWSVPSAFRLWCYLLLRAQWHHGKAPIGMVEVSLAPGQLVFGRLQAAADTGLSEQQVRSAISYLSKRGSINHVVHPTKHFSIVTICNWTSYQDSDAPEQPSKQPSANQALTKRQPSANHIQEGEEREEGEEGEEEERETAHDAKAAEIAVVWDPAKGDWDVGGLRLRRWRDSYQNIHIESEMERAANWRLEHPKRRYKNEAAFLGGWLRREEKKAADANGDGGFKRRNPTEAEIAELVADAQREFALKTPEEQERIAAEHLLRHPEHAPAVAAWRAGHG